MSEKRRDSKGRILRNGECQRKDGLYQYDYVDMNGQGRNNRLQNRDSPVAVSLAYLDW